MREFIKPLLIYFQISHETFSVVKRREALVFSSCFFCVCRLIHVWGLSFYFCILHLIYITLSSSSSLCAFDDHSPTRPSACYTPHPLPFLNVLFRSITILVLYTRSNFKRHVHIALTTSWNPKQRKKKPIFCLRFVLFCVTKEYEKGTNERKKNWTKETIRCHRSVMLIMITEKRTATM